MNLTTVVQIAQITAPLIVGSGVIIGIVQLREFQRQRREVAAVELVHSFRSAEFNRALRLVWALPDGLSGAELRARGGEAEEAALFIGTTLEAIGVLVFRRVIPIEVVDDLMGDAITTFWTKLEPWVRSLRAEQKRESVYEWFQWLVERLKERERRTSEGAHDRFRAWRA